MNPPTTGDYCRNDRIRLRYVPGKGWVHLAAQGKRGTGYVQACSDPHPGWCTRGEHTYGECWSD